MNRLVSISLLSAGLVLGFDPSRKPSQYVKRAWTIDSGLVSSAPLRGGKGWTVTCGWRRGKAFADSRNSIQELFAGGDGGICWSAGSVVAISQRLTRLMGGDIQVESRLGVGSLFYFDLPNRRVENATLGLAGDLQWEGKRVWLTVGPSALDETLGGYLTAWGMSVTRDAAEADLVVADANTVIPTALANKPALRFGEGNALSQPMRPTQLQAAIGRLPAPVSVLEKKVINQGAPMALGSPLRILVAEGNAVNQRVIQGLLRRLGYEPVIVENGRLALEAARQMPYDLMLLDLHIPEMDGLDAARQVVATVPVESRPRMVALTANAFPEDRQACMDAGMQDFLSKPIQPAQLRWALLETARGAAA